MIVYVRFGVLVRCVLCAVVLTLALATALTRPDQPDQAPPPGSTTSAQS